MNVVVVIPIYKQKLSASELASLHQCLTILRKYDICFITHKKLDIQLYELLVKENGCKFNVVFFKEDYFRNIEGYNKLCMSESLYRSFCCYEYMLIYQLDAWVFRDELDYWCSQGYDYIGAPWSSPVVFHKKEYWVGNGGFCLRRISKFLDFFNNSKKRAFSIKSLWFDIKFREPKSIIAFLCKLFGWHNNFDYLLSYFSSYGTPEDCFWSIALSNTTFKMNIPEKEIARRFSFELNPQIQFDMNCRQLPFGCHAFMRYDFESFWSEYIHIQ